MREEWKTSKNILSQENPSRGDLMLVIEEGFNKYKCLAFKKLIALYTPTCEELNLCLRYSVLFEAVAIYRAHNKPIKKERSTYITPDVMAIIFSCGCCGKALDAEKHEVETPAGYNPKNYLHVTCNECKLDPEVNKFYDTTD
jgi:hypothetical protein